MRDVSRFYSSSHDRFTYGSSFINFNLPQFFQIVKVDGRDTGNCDCLTIHFVDSGIRDYSQKSIGNMPPANQDHDTPLLQRAYFRDERAGKRGLSGMQS